MTTADWAGGEPQAGSATWTLARGNHWGRRRVRRDGTVKWMGRIWRPAADVQVMPIPGEWLMFCDYGPRYRPTAYEWTGPADPDGFLRRMYWDEVTP